MFRNVQHEANPVQTFLDFLHGPERDLFAWDASDDSELYSLVKDDDRLQLCIQDWNRYMFEIDLETWLKIGRMTRTGHRIHHGCPEYDMTIRLTALLLRYSSTPITSKGILAPFDLDPIFNKFPFASIARVGEGKYNQDFTLANFESAEFWATPQLQNWLSARSEALCHVIWHSSPHLSVLSRVRAMDLMLGALPQASSSACLHYWEVTYPE